MYYFCIINQVIDTRSSELTNTIKTFTTMANFNQFPFAVKFYGSQRTIVSNFETFNAMDEAVQEWQDKGGRCDAYEIRDGKTLDAYTGEDIALKYDDMASSN